MGDLVALTGGILAGVAVSWLALRRTALARAADRFEAWRATEGAAVRRRTTALARAATKDGVAAGSGGWDAGELGPAPADARFLGDPVAFVVFDGHTDVKDRALPALREVRFVSVPGPAPLGRTGWAGPGCRPVADGVADCVPECVAAGRVEWATVRLR